jgi:hypothetical protein
MASPFPGMDPYLESQAFWPDFHASFITYWRDALADLLPDNYEVRMDERINLVELPPEKVKRIEPDLAVTRRGPSAAAAPAPAGVGTLEPVTIPLVIEEERRETYIEVLPARKTARPPDSPAHRRPPAPGRTRPFPQGQLRKLAEGNLPR